MKVVIVNAPGLSALATAEAHGHLVKRQAFVESCLQEIAPQPHEEETRELPFPLSGSQSGVRK